MTTLIAYINHGRYMVDCPKCGNAHVVERSADTLVCPACWTGLRAQKFITDSYGALISVPHVELIFETRQQAQAAGDEYLIEYPPAEIMDVLRVRPIQNMNWVPGETIEDLHAENVAHGLEN